MKTVTNLMINEFKLRELGMDMMGYKVVRDNEYTFHHLNRIEVYYDFQKDHDAYGEPDL